ncbi:hypothetical protein TKK_0013204 [Trichogramma kaykai]|uniref:Uncharacterized protein n=1 Tax=Trichogramma kaykai TaxID=54128 RepID=A0ABD2WJG8_9HYME
MFDDDFYLSNPDDYFDDNSDNNSEDNYYYYYQIGKNTEGSRNDYDSDDACQEDLELLKGLRGKVNWEIEEERRKLLRELHPLIQKWRGQLPDLRDIFRKEEIDWLLLESVRNMRDPDLISRGGEFIDFVSRSGYRDKPEIDENDKPLLHHTTPVHYAAESNYTIVVPLLLKIYTRFDANYIDESGLTHFHAACMADCEDVVEKFLRLGQDPNLVWPKTGDSPLHLALAGRSRYVTRLLIKNGADPNSINKDGSTPLHVCQRYSDDDMLEIFLKMMDDIQQAVRVDARDKLGRTPLELAVANFQPHAVDLLLNHGADLSNFVFPTENHLVEALKPRKSNHREFVFDRLKIVSNALSIVQCLEKKGYELNQSDGLTIIKIFAHLGIFKKSLNLKNCWYDDKQFATSSKKLMMNSSLSLNDFMKLRPKKAEKLLTFTDYLNLANRYAWWHIQERFHELCIAHLCDIMSRRFCLRWALKYFLSLTQYQLPILCCEKIIGQLMNEDLLNMCLATEVGVKEQPQPE